MLVDIRSNCNSTGSYSTPGPSEGDPSRPAPNDPTFKLLSWATIWARISRISLGTVLS